MFGFCLSTFAWHIYLWRKNSKSMGVKLSESSLVHIEYTVFLFGKSELHDSFVSEIVRRKGLEHVTVDDLVTEITPKGRGNKFTSIIW